MPATPGKHFDLDRLSEALSRLTTTDEKASTIVSHFSDAQTAITPAGAELFDNEEFSDLLDHHGVSHFDLARAMPSRAKFALEQIPCAYTNVNAEEECLKDGTALCTNCRLVLYCSKECQKGHWKAHRDDCKSYLRSKDWEPGWVEEQRAPIFVTGTPRNSSFSQGMALWGGVPAIDILNLQAGERKTNVALDIAFIASGDLRNLIHTVNRLPKDYTGKINVLFNDRLCYVVLRNVILLKALASIPDKRKAADLSLHLWYSAFIPQEYAAEMLSLVMSIATGSGIHEVKLGEKARLKADIDSDTHMLCSALVMSSRMYNASDAVESLTSARLPPSRKDLRHRHYLPMEPSHRVANLEYMRTGMLLPFGAHNVYFNEPNRSLFSPKGEWLQTDFADPIQCWDIDEVIKSGNAHGASREDLYGCLYFHVSDQLYEFADRLSRFDISLNILGRDAVELSSSIKKGDLTSQFGIPSSIRFDRIDVSNIVDEHYKIGIAGVIDAWGDFLKPNKEATIIGHFMNWSGKDVDAEPNDHNCDAEALATIAQNKGRLPDIIPPELKTAKSLTPKNRDRLMALMSMVTAMTHTMMTSVYDNSRAFDRYLLNYGLNDALKRNKLKRKTKHTIVPHRLCASVHDPPSALPEFKDKDSWYLHSRIHSMTWTERYIEICRS